MEAKSPGRWGIALSGTTPAPQSKPVTPTSRLVARIAPSVAFQLGLSVPAAGPATTDTTPILGSHVTLWTNSWDRPLLPHPGGSESLASTQEALGFHQAKGFYGETLGLKNKVLDEENSLLQLDIAGDRPTLVYLKPDLAPGNYTILNFPVDDIDKTVDGLAERGVSFERYEGFDQDDKGIARGPGPAIAWFKGPAGNILSVMKQD
jgi:hypothetical protein